MDLNIALMVTFGKRSLLVLMGDGPFTAPVDLNVDLMVRIIDFNTIKNNMYQRAGRYPRATSVRGRGISLPPNEIPDYRSVRKKRRGRPTDSRLISQENFQHKYLSAYRSAQDEKQGPPTQLDVAMKLGITDRTLRTYLDKYNAPWPPT